MGRPPKPGSGGSVSQTQPEHLPQAPVSAAQQAPPMHGAYQQPMQHVPPVGFAPMEASQQHQQQQQQGAAALRGRPAKPGSGGSVSQSLPEQQPPPQAPGIATNLTPALHGACQAMQHGHAPMAAVQQQQQQQQQQEQQEAPADGAQQRRLHLQRMRQQQLGREAWAPQPAQAQQPLQQQQQQHSNGQQAAQPAAPAYHQPSAPQHQYTAAGVPPAQPQVMPGMAAWPQGAGAAPQAQQGVGSAGVAVPVAGPVPAPGPTVQLSKEPYDLVDGLMHRDAQLDQATYYRCVIHISQRIGKDPAVVHMGIHAKTLWNGYTAQLYNNAREPFEIVTHSPVPPHLPQRQQLGPVLPPAGQAQHQPMHRLPPQQPPQQAAAQAAQGSMPQPAPPTPDPFTQHIQQSAAATAQPSRSAPGSAPAPAQAPHPPPSQYQWQAGTKASMPSHAGSALGEQTAAYSAGAPPHAPQAQQQPMPQASWPSQPQPNSFAPASLQHPATQAAQGFMPPQAPGVSAPYVQQQFQQFAGASGPPPQQPQPFPATVAARASGSYPGSAPAPGQPPSMHVHCPPSHPGASSGAVPLPQPMASHADSAPLNTKAGGPSPVPQSAPTSCLSLLSHQVPEEQRTLPSRTLTTVMFVAGAACALQPGEVRLAGLTLHPQLADMYRQRQEAWRTTMNTNGTLEDALDTPHQQVAVDRQYDALVERLGGKLKLRKGVAKVLGLQAGGSLDVMPPQQLELRGVTAVAADSGGDGVSRGRGLVAAQDLPLGYVLGPLGGYLLPSGLKEQGLARQQFHITEEELQGKGLPPFPDNVAPMAVDWELDCRRYTFEFDLATKDGQGVASLAVWGLGYGNTGMLINDTVKGFKKWVVSNAAKPEAAMAGLEPGNVEVVVVEFRGQPLPMLVCSRAVPAGTPLRCNYGFQWWKEYAAAWGKARDLHEDEDKSYERERQDTMLPLQAATQPLSAPAPAARPSSFTGMPKVEPKAEARTAKVEPKAEGGTKGEVGRSGRGRDVERERDRDRDRRRNRSRSRSRDRKAERKAERRGREHDSRSNHNESNGREHKGKSKVDAARQDKSHLTGSGPAVKGEPSSRRPEIVTLLAPPPPPPGLLAYLGHWDPANSFYKQRLNAAGV